MADRFELAHQTWPILIDAAKKRRTLSYGEIADQLGYRGARPVRMPLWTIQDFCLEKRLPPLTSLVLNQKTRKPGSGFIAWDGDIKDAHRRVFDFKNWHLIPTPFPPGSRAQLTASGTRGNGDSDVQHFEVPDQMAFTNGRGPYQAKFRRLLLQLYDWECALCETSLESLLVASHIVPWAADSATRLNPQNGLLLCRTHDCLFDSGVLKIAPEGRVSWPGITKNSLGRDLYDFVTERTASRLRMPTGRHRPAPEFLQWRLDNPGACSPDREA